MATRSKNARTFASQIDWRVVGVASVMAGLFVLSSVFAAWAAGRPMSSIKGSLVPLSFSKEAAKVAGIATTPDDKDRSNESMDTQEATNSQGGDNSSAGPDQIQAAAVYPEGDNRVVAPAPDPSLAAEQKSEPATDCEMAVAVAFARDPMEAARKAREEHKLMFVLHVSGNFEESKFT
jgi:hypothetical protein